MSLNKEGENGIVGFGGDADNLFLYLNISRFLLPKK